MAVLPTQNPTLAGLTPAYSAAAGGGDKVAADGKTFLIVKNGGGAPITVTITTPATVRGLAVADPAVSVPAGAERWIGPFARDAFGNADGQVDIAYSGVTSVTVAAVSS